MRSILPETYLTEVNVKWSFFRIWLYDTFAFICLLVNVDIEDNQLANPISKTNCSEKHKNISESGVICVPSIKKWHKKSLIETLGSHVWRISFSKSYMLSTLLEWWSFTKILSRGKVFCRCRQNCVFLVTIEIKSLNKNWNTVPNSLLLPSLYEPLSRSGIFLKIFFIFCCTSVSLLLFWDLFVI